MEKIAKIIATALIALTVVIGYDASKKLLKKGDVKNG